MAEMTVYDELVARGLIAQVTDEELIIGTVLMFHPGPAALSIYKQNPRNDPLYSALFPLDPLGFRTKKLYSVTKTQIL